MLHCRIPSLLSIQLLQIVRRDLLAMRPLKANKGLDYLGDVYQPYLSKL
jgi:hypothetical protein